ILFRLENLVKETDHDKRITNTETNANKISHKIFGLFKYKKQSSTFTLSENEKGFLVFTKYSTIVLIQMYDFVDRSTRITEMRDSIVQTLGL
ncbi:hypothetical protein LCGC14_2171810, partial [marine sediment metagenome]